LSKRQKAAGAAVLAIACVLTYGNGIGGDFTYDDKAIVRDNVRIRSPSKIGEIFATSYFGGPSGTGSNYRPILLLSYAVQWWIHGRQAESFHAVNILLHFGATWLLLLLLVRVGVAPAAAFVTALLFAVHPIHVEAVTSLVGRGELLSAVLTLLYLLLSLRSFRLPPHASRLPALLGALLCYALAVLTKESAASAPAIAFLLFLFVEEGAPGERVRRAILRGLPVLAVSAFALGGVFLLRGQVLGGFLRSGGDFFEVENVLAPLEPVERIANACLVLFRYVGRILFPLHLSADESAWSIEPVGPLSPLAIAAVLLFVALVVVSIIRLGRASPASFGFLFFLLAFLPASNLLFPIGTGFAERLAYLPAAGLFLAAGAAIAGAAPGWVALAPRRRAVVVLLVLALSVRAVVRNAVWWGDEALFLNLIRTSPDSAKAHYDIAYIWADDKQYVRAREQYTRATELYEDYWDAWTGKGRTEKELKLFDEAEKSYERGIAANPGHDNGYFGLGLVREERGDLAGAEEIYRRGLSQKKDSLPLAYRLALARSRLPWPEALTDWRRALELGATVASVHEGFASWLARVGKTAEARHHAREAWRRAPGYLPALRLLADLDSRSGQFFAEALAREQIFRLSRSREDFASLRASAEKTEAYAARFARNEKTLAKLLQK
jgi:tetratricopeptide (TPR) repeat protein